MYQPNQPQSGQRPQGYPARPGQQSLPHSYPSQGQAYPVQQAASSHVPQGQPAIPHYPQQPAHPLPQQNAAPAPRSSRSRITRFEIQFMAVSFILFLISMIGVLRGMAANILAILASLAGICFVGMAIWLFYKFNRQ